MAWFDRRWQYRKSHVIEGSAGAGTNYQVRIRPYYAEPQKNQFELNPSDGLHVHCSPAGLYYSDSSAKTYFVWLDTNAATYTAKIRSFDHDNKRWGSIYTVTAGFAADVHGACAIGVLPNDKLIVFYGSHQTDQLYKISTNAEDESAWGAEQSHAGDWTYPQVCSFGDKLVLFLRDSSDTNRHRWKRNTTVDGSAWTGWTTVVDFGAGFKPYFMFHKVGALVFCSGHVHIIAGATNEDLHFCYSDDEGSTWKEADDTAVVLPVDADQRIAITPHNTVFTYAMLDESGKPIVVARKHDVEKEYHCQYDAALGDNGAWTNDFMEDSGGTDLELDNFFHPFLQDNVVRFWAGHIDDGKMKKFERVSGQVRRYSVEETDDQYIYGPAHKQMHVVENGLNAANNQFEVFSCERTCLLSHRILARPGAAVDTNEEVFLHGKCKTDFGDIRFTAADGVTELDYWLEEYTASKYATFWVEVAADLGSDKTIYVYYGNVTVATTSSGANTFPIFDDFARSDGGTVGGGWTQEDGDGANSIDTECLKIVQHMNEYTHIERSQAQTNLVLRSKLLTGANAGASWLHAMALYWGVDEWGKWGQRRDGGGDELKFNFFHNKASTVTNWLDLVGAAGVWYYLRLRLTGTTMFADRSCDGIWWYASTSTARGANWSAAPSLIIIGKGWSDEPGYPNADFDNDYASAGNEGTHYGDDVFTRKYVSPEPAHGAWGREYRVPRIQGFVM